MIVKLRKRLIRLFTVFTAILLTVIILFAFLNDMNQRNETQKLFFRNLFTSATFELQQYNESYFEKLEDSYDMLIKISDGEQVLRGTDSKVFKELQDTLGNVSITSTGENSTPVQTNTVTINYDGTRYLGAMAIGANLKMEMIYPLPSYLDLMGTSIFLYTFIWIISIVSIYLLGRYLVKQALRPVEENMKAQKEFIAAVSHELKSPLTVIKAHAEESDSKVILRECNRMSKLIQDMLSLTTSDRGEWEMHKTYIQPDSLLIETYEAYDTYARGKNIELKVDLPKYDLPQISVDKARMLQVLGILVDNAINYSLAGTEVMLKAELKNKTLEIAVIDHGKGISDQEKIRVFDRFYRVDKSRTDKEHFGLGLSIADEIIRVHGGRILLEDTPDMGVTFIISIAL